MQKKNIAIFASGEGTNAQRIMQYFFEKDIARVSLLVSNRADAKVLEKSRKMGIESLVISRTDLYESDFVVNELKKRHIDIIILAGFLWIVPENLIKAFPDKIINVHPALLPKFGGKGMYGMNVHKAVIEAKEKESGISIHFVNEHYDEGKIIAQYKCDVSENDTAETLAKKIQELEHLHFSQVIEQFIERSKRTKNVIGHIGDILNDTDIP